MDWYTNSSGKIKRFLEEELLNRRNVISGLKSKRVVEMARIHSLKASDIRSLENGLEETKLNAPQTHQERIGQLMYLMELLLDDDYLDDRKFDFLIGFSKTIGIDVKASPRIIKEMYDAMKQGKSMEEINQLCV